MRTNAPEAPKGSLPPQSAKQEVRHGFVLGIAGAAKPLALGQAIGTAPRAIGKARALALNETEGALCGMSMSLAGLLPTQWLALHSPCPPCRQRPKNQSKPAPAGPSRRAGTQLRPRLQRDRRQQHGYPSRGSQTKTQRLLDRVAPKRAAIASSVENPSATILP
jgi:hypothetical protein